MRPVLTCCLLAFAACKSDKDVETGTDTTDTTDTVTDTTDTTDTTTQPPPDPLAFVRFLNAAEPFGAVDLYVDGAVRAVLDPLGATPFSEIDPGSHNIGMAPEGADPTEFGALITLDIVKSTKTSAILIGEPAASSILWVNDDASGLAQSENRLWFAHGALGAPTIDVVDVTTGTVLVNDLAYGAAASVVVPAGPATFGVDFGDDGVDLTYDFTGNLQRVFVPLTFAYTTPEVTTGTASPVLALVALPPQGSTATVFLPQSVSTTTAAP